MQKKSKSRMWQAALAVSASSALTFPAFVYGQSSSVGTPSSESGYYSNHGTLGQAGAKDNAESSSTKDSQPSSRTQMEPTEKTAKGTADHTTAESDKMQKSAKDSSTKDSTLSSSSDLKAKDKTMADHDHMAAGSDKAQQSSKESSAKSTEHNGNASMAAAEKAGKTKEDRTGTEQESNKSSNY